MIVLSHFLSENNVFGNLKSRILTTDIELPNFFSVGSNNNLGGTKMDQIQE